MEEELEEMMEVKRKIPSLVDLCVQKAIDNRRYLGDVGETDFHLLERILPHCSLEQLMHIENSTEDRDLSPVTNNLWKIFYRLEFGEKSTKLVVDRMKEKKRVFKWRDLYQAKLKDVEEAQQKSFDRIKELYQKEGARKQSRQVKLCTKVPPSSNKRSFYGGCSSIGNTKSNVMKKAKLDYLNSREVKNAAAAKRNAIQKTHFSAPVIRKPPSGSYSSRQSGAPTSPSASLSGRLALDKLKERRYY
jgi:elongin-A